MCSSGEGKSFSMEKLWCRIKGSDMWTCFGGIASFLHCLTVGNCPLLHFRSWI